MNSSVVPVFIRMEQSPHRHHFSVSREPRAGLFVFGFHEAGREETSRHPVLRRLASTKIHPPSPQWKAIVWSALLKIPFLKHVLKMRLWCLLRFPQPRPLQTGLTLLPPNEPCDHKKMFQHTWNAATSNHIHAFSIISHKLWAKRARCISAHRLWALDTYSICISCQPVKLKCCCTSEMYVCVLHHVWHTHTHTKCQLWKPCVTQPPALCSSLTSWRKNAGWV